MEHTSAEEVAVRSLAPIALPAFVQRDGKAVNFRGLYEVVKVANVERRKTTNLAFNAFKDPCPSRTKEQVELCKGFDYGAMLSRHTHRTFTCRQEAARIQECSMHDIAAAIHASLLIHTVLEDISFEVHAVGMSEHPTGSGVHSRMLHA